MKDMIKDAIILFVITLIAGLALGYVYHITKEPIMIAKQSAKEAAYKEVYKDAKSFEELTVKSLDEIGFADAGFNGITIDEVLKATNDNGEGVGYVILVTTNAGYGGDISFSLGITNEGIINGISILSISETAGLGMRADEVLKPQFDNVKAETFTVTKVGKTADNQIDAISGATITSNAVTNAVNAGVYYFNNAIGGGSDEE